MEFGLRACGCIFNSIQTEVQILAGSGPWGRQREAVPVQAPLLPVPLKQCRALAASGAFFKHIPGAPEVLKWSPWNKHCRVSGAHDHQVFWKFAFSIPLYLGKRKPVFCVLQTSAVTSIHKQVLPQATKRFPTQIFIFLRTF